ncbi:hypothetical protein FOZ61_006813 [Perkinsus olseni]|uniref:Thioredoxin domain-containing protein n=1 Tax=Perkinsus olseni TaxID=32597 RepID=A0A7J6MHM3_PEROL|nr:hypothetical protein FOZ61_006813 [Perkinsus olseni]KAF4676057.1 hypothetical protein FOL46_007935 [Perkinsus olseni]
MPSFWAVRKSSSPASPQHLRERLCEMPKNSHIYSPSNLRRLVRVPIAPDYDEACDALATHPEEQPEFGNRRKVRTEKVCFGTPTGHKNLRLDFLHSHNEDGSDGSTVTSSKLTKKSGLSSICEDVFLAAERPSKFLVIMTPYDLAAAVVTKMPVVLAHPIPEYIHGGGYQSLPDRHTRSGSLAARSSMPEVRIEKNDIVSTEGVRLPAGPTREHSDDTDLRSRLRRVEDGGERIRRKLLMSAGDAMAFKLGKRRLLEEPVQPSRGERCQPPRSEALAFGKSPCPLEASSRERGASPTQITRAIERCVDSLCSKRLDDYADLPSMPPQSRKAAVRLFDAISIDLECLRRQIRRELARLHTRGSAEDRAPGFRSSNRESRQLSSTRATKTAPPALTQFARSPPAPAISSPPTLSPTYHRRVFNHSEHPGCAAAVARRSVSADPMPSRSCRVAAEEDDSVLLPNCLTPQHCSSWFSRSCPMSALAGKTLLTQDGSEVKADDVLSSKEKIALYFSAHWCPPCRKFTPILKEFYEDVKEEDEDKLEIIFISSDKSEEEQVEYHKEEQGEWLRVPYGDVETRDALKKEFGVCAGIEKENLGIINNHKSGIPCLLVLDEDKKDVKIFDGVNDVKTMGPVAVDMKW